MTAAPSMHNLPKSPRENGSATAINGQVTARNIRATAIFPPEKLLLSEISGWARGICATFPCFIGKRGKFFENFGGFAIFEQGSGDFFKFSELFLTFRLGKDKMICGNVYAGSVCTVPAFHDNRHQPGCSRRTGRFPAIRLAALNLHLSSPGRRSCQ